MKIKILILACLFAGAVSGQETKLRCVGMDAGILFLNNETLKMDYVRKDMPTMLDGKTYDKITSLSYKSYFEIKPEIFIFKNKFSLSAGLRFSQLSNSIGKTDYWSKGNNYFYWLTRQEGVNTEYLKVKQVNQSFNYLGVPLEIKIYPFKPRLFTVFFKIGGEINYLIESKTDVVFYDSSMEPYQNEITDKIGKPGSFSSSFFGAGGVRYGRESRLMISIEACVPYVFLTTETSGLVNPQFGGGFQISVQLPLKSKVK